MSIRIEDNCGSLPTSVQDGFLCIHGLRDEVVARVQLPFKTKFNGPMCKEFIKYPNVYVFTPVELGILVMRYDGTYTIYNNKWIPVRFGNFDFEQFSSFVVVDRLGCYSEIPHGCKKLRLYAAYLFRFRESNKIMYTCLAHPMIWQVLHLRDQEVVDLLNKGLNSGTEGFPDLSSFQDCLWYNKSVIIPTEIIDVHEPAIQRTIPHAQDTDTDKFYMLYRVRPYASIICEYQSDVRFPSWLSKIVDTNYLLRPDRAIVERNKSDVIYQMAAIMNKHQDYIVMCELNAQVCYAVNDLGNVFYHRIFHLEMDVIDFEGTRETLMATGSLGLKLCGFVAEPVLEISTPTIIPRIAKYNNTVFIGEQEVALDLDLADVPEAKMPGYIECAEEGGKAVVYLKDKSYKILK